jgi:hypothetical protein
VIDPLRVLLSRAEARAVLYRAGEFDLYHAVAPLFVYADDAGIIKELGEAAVLALIRQAFPDEALLVDEKAA